jgi:membrane peptidoglycan carboxypeptidase
MPSRKRYRPIRWARLATRMLALTLLAAAAALLYGESQSSWLQAEVLSRYAARLDYRLEPGPSPAIAFPDGGPYDRRLGYTILPQTLERLGGRGFGIEQQARLSPAHQQFVERGGFAIYDEKARAGLTLLDHGGEPLLAARFPGRTFPSFAAIPPLVVETLLFIENRQLLDARHPNRNPAIDWARLVRVLPGAVAQQLDPGRRAPGGSTLATQIEKFRHSSAGRTDDARDKLRQIVSASVRSYRYGPDTRRAREQLVVDYLNSTPLAAQAGFGEVLGLGDGLFAWFGTELAEASALLKGGGDDPEQEEARGRVYKQALALLLAQRRPAYYLRPEGRRALEGLIAAYLHLLVEDGRIPDALAVAAREAPLEILPRAPERAAPSFVDEKAANALRAELLQTLGIASTYQLDRLDLQVQTTLDRPTQQRVTEVLRGLGDPEVARRLGLVGHRLLQGRAKDEEPVYSLTVYERGEGVNRVRVQTDNLDRPFDLNQGAKLDLGSTAKLRTLITYLEIVAEIHGKLVGLERAELALRARQGDPLTRFVAEELIGRPEADLAAVIEAAMARRYAANPGERFFTGGGMHTFGNFDRDDNGRVMSVAQAFRNSVNLPFVRIMRDIVRYHSARDGVDAEALLEDAAHPGRRDYLARSAEREAREFLHRYWRRYAGLEGEAALVRLASEIGNRPRRLAAAFRSARPEAGPDELVAFLAVHAPGTDTASARRLFTAIDAPHFTLADRAYLANVHPLQLWLVGHLQASPSPSWAAVIEASAEARATSYEWLFKTRNKRAQDRRIRILLEEEAFARIHQSWVRQGYPFARMVPSLASALGSSADRPDALAELMGIILNDGVRQPSARIERLHFAADTPYETVLGLEPPEPERVLAPEVAAAVRRALADVVASGTARRMHQAFMGDDGSALVIGAKTGTGDHKRKRYGPGGRFLGEEAVSRTATVVFFVGERFFGTVTVFVPGPASADFGFTSSLPAQLLKGLAPALEPLFNHRSAPRTASAGPPPEG